MSELPEPEDELPEPEDEVPLELEPELEPEPEEEPDELLLEEPVSVDPDELPFDFDVSVDVVPDVFDDWSLLPEEPLAAFAFSVVFSCAVCSVVLDVKIGSVFSPMPWPAVNTWIKTAETAMASSAETTETIKTLRCTRALR